MPDPIAVIREGTGPEIVLVHGGASPSTTWSALRPLSSRWTLAFVHRRGYPPSPPGDHDFDVDADDIERLLEARPHLVAHSYGALGALIVAARRPTDVRSLTILEPPVYFVASGDPEVQRLRRLGDDFLTQGLDMDPAELREFLRLAGAPDVGAGPLSEEVVRSVRRSHGGRLAGEAEPQLEVIRDAGVPCLVASGDHARAMERICDGLAEALNAQRLVAPGAGHFVAAAPGFADAFEEFIASAANG
ncbi:MAG: alpha/beta fold hydrolase [Thermoleophilaceae bacterium]